MKKVGIITFHFPTNYGAKLQCVALFKFLTQKGMDVEIIDYRPRYHSWKYAYFRNPFYIAKSITNGVATKEFWKTVIRFTLSYGKLNRLFKNIKNIFFDMKYYKLSDKYISYEELSESNKIYDCVIVGSDQIWNYHLTNGEYDKAYFADFVPEQTKKIAYAPSVGNVPDTKHMVELVSLLSCFDGISVRESSLKNELIKYNIKATEVVDPTMLLNMEEWEKIEKKPNLYTRHAFICVYSLFLNDQIVEIVSKCAQKYSCDIIDLSPTPRKKTGWKYALTCDPAEFLWYIHNSKMVVADSFHALAFSIIYQKQFISVAVGRTTSRIKDLLEELGLNNRVFAPNVLIEEYFEPIDYSKVNKIIARNKLNSECYLKKLLDI